jgi:ribosome assembly protein 4
LIRFEHILDQKVLFRISDSGLLRGHKKWVSCLAWEPFVSNQDCRRLASGSKDGTTKIWDSVTKNCLLTLGGHTGGITSIKWGGAGLLYTAAKDRTIKVWSPERGVLVRTLEGHAHWY